MAKPSDLKSVIEAKNLIISDYRQALVQHSGRLRNVSDISADPTGVSLEQSNVSDFAPISGVVPDERLAVGVGRKRGGKFFVDLRVERPAGIAYAAAKTIQDRVQASDVSVIREVTSPTREDERGETRSGRPKTRIRPLRIGLSIGCAQTNSGTLGVFVKIRFSGKRSLGFLSTTSVLASGETPGVGDWIYQPGRPDVETLSSKLRIARVKDYFEIARFVRNKSDAALAELTDEAQEGVTENRIPKGFPGEGKAIRNVHGDCYEWLGKTVAKIGSTTGYTEGKVTAVSIDGLIVSRGRENVAYDDVFEIRSKSNRPFSAPGDSGALVFLKRERSAIGLVFAGGRTKDGRVSYACRLDYALKAFRCDLLA